MVWKELLLIRYSEECDGDDGIGTKDIEQCTKGSYTFWEELSLHWSQRYEA